MKTARDQAIYIPTIEDLAAPDPHGILYCSVDYCIKYLDIQNKKSYRINKRDIDPGPIRAILVHEGEVYFARGKNVSTIFSLSGGIISDVREEGTCTMSQQRGKILDAGEYGIMDSLNDIQLISRKAMKKRNLDVILSMPVDDEGNLFVLAGDDKGDSRLLEVKEKHGTYYLADEIFRYNNKHGGISQVHFLPQGSFRGDNGRYYPFSILGCAEGKFLDLNGRKIINTDANGSIPQIYQIALLKKTGEILQVAYCGAGNMGIHVAKIHLNARRALENTILGGHSPCGAMQPIMDHPLHQKLLDRGKEQAPAEQRAGQQ